MKIEASKFDNFPKKGAIRIELNDMEVEVTDSIFSRCNNDVSGGAVRVYVTSGNYKFDRDCGTECYTIVSDNANDFGQFLYVGCSQGNIKYENLAVSFCPSRVFATMQNGPLSLIGNADLKCSHSNSSNNYCQFGPGFASYNSNNAYISYMNFANGTAHTTTRNKDWVAAVFHSTASGTVTMSNFFECVSKVSNPSKPLGTFTKCFFTRCENYKLSLLSSDNKENTQSNFAFPKKCAAQIAVGDKIDDLHNVKVSILTVIFGLTFNQNLNLIKK